MDREWINTQGQRAYDNAAATAQPKAMLAVVYGVKAIVGALLDVADAIREQTGATR